MGDISKDINSNFKDNRLKAFVNLKYTSNWLNSKENEFFRPYAISAQQYNILRILRGAQDKLKVQTVKQRMIERAPNTTRLMDKLCDKNLIVRTRCNDDRRVVYAEITKDGLELLSTIDENKNISFLKNLTDQEAMILSDLLDKIR